MVHRGHVDVGHMFSKGFSVIDVRDPRRPRLVTYLPARENTWNIHVQTADDLLLVINAKDVFAAAEFQDEHAYHRPNRARVIQSCDVFVDAEGLVYSNDCNGGLRILEYEPQL